jgi:hypothetical protein
MSKRAIIAAAGALALAAFVGALGLRDRHPRRAPVEDEPEVVAAPPPVAAPVPAAAKRPLPSSTGPRPAPPQAASPARPSHDPGPPAEDEATLMAKLRGLEGTDPPLTLRLAREGNARFPDSPDAPERAWMVVKSLANMERFQEARDEAQTMVNRYPGTSWAFDVQRHLLSNPLD